MILAKLILINIIFIDLYQGTNNKIKMLAMKKMAKILLIAPKSLVFSSRYGVHHDGLQLPKQFNHKYQDWQKQILYKKMSKKKILKIEASFFDILQIPGFEPQEINGMFKQFMQRKVNLSPEHVVTLIIMFTKHNVMTDQAYDMIQSQAYRYKGEYKIRSIFGGIVSSLLYNRHRLARFFIEESKSSPDQLSFSEICHIISTLTKNSEMTLQQKRKYWEEDFKQQFIEKLLQINNLKTTMITSLYKSFTQLQQTDERIWKTLITRCKFKKGWSRVYALQVLYNLSGQYQEAQSLFNKFFQHLSQDAEIVKYYNLTEMRWKTPLELIKQAQQNPDDYEPKIRTLIPEGNNVDEWNEKYRQFLLVGSVKEQAQIIKDKSKSLGFAILERYEMLKADGQDFSEMSKDEFTQMFGDYQKIQGTIKTEDEKIEIAQAKKAEEDAIKAKLQEEQKQKKKAQKSKSKKKK